MTSATKTGSIHFNRNGTAPKPFPDRFRTNYRTGIQSLRALQNGKRGCSTVNSNAPVRESSPTARPCRPLPNPQAIGRRLRMCRTPVVESGLLAGEGSHRQVRAEGDSYHRAQVRPAFGTPPFLTTGRGYVFLFFDTSNGRSVPDLLPPG